MQNQSDNNNKDNNKKINVPRISFEEFLEFERGERKLKHGCYRFKPGNTEEISAYFLQR